MINVFETQLVRAKVRTWNTPAQRVDTFLVQGYVAPPVINEERPVMGLFITAKDKYSYFGLGMEGYSSKFFGETEVLWETVGRYIGLKDKNGRRIFEGDIVKYYYCGVEYQDKYELKLVEWVDECCGFEPFSDSRENCGHCGGSIDHTWCEVVGNIHDDPEFLKTQIDKGNNTMQQINSIREYYYAKTIKEEPNDTQTIP